MICRAEQRAVMLISPDAQMALIPSERYGLIEDMLSGGQADSGAFSVDLEKAGFLAWMRENADTVRTAMERSETVQPPENAYAAPVLLNLELTTRCPLNCPQCYCDLHRGKDLPLDRATEVLRQAAQLGTSNINLSGGETMVYPHLYELLAQCSSLGLCAAVALSGWGVDESSLQKLIGSGVTEIYISLNGSTEEVSRITRDGHHLAIRALELLKESGFKSTAVNWVAHRSNIHDFENVAALCSRLGVKRLVVMAFKPDSTHSLASAPADGQTLELAGKIKQLQKQFPELSIDTESCYSPLRALLGQKFFGNLNVGISKGCGAGRDGASLDVDGSFTPCRHLDYPESFDSLRDYWYASGTLQELRAVEAAPEAPCAGCKYGPYCLSCLAVNAKLHGAVVKANKYCDLWH